MASVFLLLSILFCNTIKDFSDWDTIVWKQNGLAKYGLDIYLTSMWAIQDGNRTWSIPSTETSDSILPNSESRISLTSLYHHSDGRTLWNLFGLCFNNCPDSWIIEQSSKTRILILNPRDDNSYTTLNRLSTHSTFPQLFGTWVTCYQMSTRSKGSAHLFMEAYLTSHFFSMQVDFMLYICNDFLLLVRWYITPKQKNMLIEKRSC